jgi:hypothetical protein
MEIELKSSGHLNMNISTGTGVAVASIRRAMPAPVKSALRPVVSWSRDLRERFSLWNQDRRFPQKYGFSAPPLGTDFVGYEGLIDFFCAKELTAVPGDLVEIGAFRGGGTYKLAKFLQKQGSQKKVYTIDCFDIQFDKTQNCYGMSMAQLYMKTLKGKSQRQVFDQVTAGIPNIVVIAGDSRTVELPAEAVCFGFIDGNHSDEYVVSDFYLVWGKLSPGGVVAFHDYGHDLPNVTAMIDLLCARHSSEIAEVRVDAERHVIYLLRG